MASTYTPIATQTLTSAAASITFSSIPTTYTDLILVMSGGQNESTIEIQVGNGSVDTGANYSRTYVYGDGSVGASARNSNISVTYNTFGSTANTGNGILHFMNYSNTTTNKTILMRGNEASAVTSFTTSLWRSNSAINVIKIAGYTSNLLAGSTFSLYGIKAA
jgi:hypothetical protein